MGIQNGRWLSRPRLHSLVTLTLAAALLAVGGFLATGVLGVPTPAPPPPSPLPTPDGSWEPAAPWVRPAPNADFLPLLVGQKVEVFEYNGPPVSTWIEVEMDGQRTRLGGRLGSDWAKEVGLPADAVPSGYILCERSKSGEKEVWRLAVGVRNKAGKVVLSVVEDDLRPPGWGRVPGSGAVYGGSGYVVPDKDETYTLYSGVDLGPGEARRKVELRCRFLRGQ